MRGVDPQQVDDVVEIVPVGAGAAYVRFRLYFASLHSCSFYGIAEAHKAGFFIVSRRRLLMTAPCTLQFRKVGDRL